MGRTKGGKSAQGNKGGTGWGRGAQQVAQRGLAQLLPKQKQKQHAVLRHSPHTTRPPHLLQALQPALRLLRLLLRGAQGLLALGNRLLVLPAGIQCSGQKQRSCSGSGSIAQGREAPQARGQEWEGLLPLNIRPSAHGYRPCSYAPPSRPRIRRWNSAALF